MTYPAYKESTIISELSSRFKLGKNFLRIVSIDVGLPGREAIFDAKNRPWFSLLKCNYIGSTTRSRKTPSSAVPRNLAKTSGMEVDDTCIFPPFVFWHYEKNE